MNQAFDSYSSLESALNARFRGHDVRNWQEWAERHHFDAAGLIPPDAERAWLNRQKLNYQGLADRRALRHLVGGNVDQPMLEEIGQLSGLRRLELEWPFVATDLAPLLALHQLEHLSIDSPRKLSDFSPLLELPALRTLLITNARKMSDIAWLGEANRLEVIGIEGAIDSPCRLDSLAPLAGLDSLRAFLGASLRLADQRLAPLAQCPRLEYLGIARCAPRTEFEQLHRARPGLVCRWFDPDAWRKPTLKALG